MDIESFKHSFDEIFLSELDRLLSRTKKRVHNTHIHGLLSHTYELAKNGKRIRPYVMALSYGAHTFDDAQEISDQLVGIELLHLFALVHDDIMDEALTRHGVASMNSFSENCYEDLPNKNLQGKYEAILLGDLIFSFAYELFSKGKGIHALPLFFELVDEVITGQMLDIRIPFEEKVTKDMIRERMLFKTARYSFARPMQIGAMLSEINSKDEALYFSLGEELGIIYQITDDIIDIYGSKKDTKKTPLQDLYNGQETLLSFYIKEHCPQSTQDTLNQLSKRSLTEDEIKIAQELFESSGALQFAKNEIKTHYENAENKISLLGEKENTWAVLLSRLANRIA
jgi:geranylgeranyl diphosphate synthase type I